MEGMRELFRGQLGRSLRALPELDRLRAAWTVACGKTMAGHGEVIGFGEGVLRVSVADGVWLGQMRAMRGALERDVAHIAGVKLDGIHFSLGVKPRE